ncbi:MAG: hypothetical protein K9G30_05460, partial [Parvibaculum sp.]|nr:hypothetical protein [Parvibaculum sp.]
MAGSLKFSRKIILAVAGLALLGARPPAADVALPPESDAAARGLAVVEEMDRRDHGWGDAAAEMKMLLTNSAGDVFPCCLKTKLPLGNLTEEHLVDIL